MKPKLVQLYETSSGATVKTLAEWKVSELEFALGSPKSGPEGSEIIRTQLVARLIEKEREVLEILSVKEKGRPLNRKDSKPRKPRVVADETKAA